MLTKNKLVLVVDESQSYISEYFRYEGMKVCSTLEEIREAHRLNRTPIVSMRDMTPSLTTALDWRYVPSVITEEAFIQFANAIGIDPGEFVKKTTEDEKEEMIKNMANEDECLFCRHAKHVVYKTWINQVIKAPHDYDINMMESKNFYVKIEFGSIMPGMCMILSKKHFYSESEFPQEFLEEYEDMKKDVEFILTSIYGGIVTFFEHGSSRTVVPKHASSLVHMHLHVYVGMPFDKALLRIIPMRKIDHMAEAINRKFFSWQETTNGDKYVCDEKGVYIPRQFGRRIIAEMHNSTEWNWKHHPNNLNMTRTINDWFGFLKENWGSLPQRIQDHSSGFFEGYPRRLQ